jgi:hypothetical protein
MAQAIHDHRLGTLGDLMTVELDAILESLLAQVESVRSILRGEQVRVGMLTT